jgi:hypothetical protein
MIVAMFQAMIDIWANFYRGRVTMGIAVTAFLFMLGMSGFLQYHWILIGILCNTFVVGFVLPAVIYLIDTHTSVRRR